MIDLDTPAGPFTMVVSEAGAVRAAGFTTDVAELLALSIRSYATKPGRRTTSGRCGRGPVLSRR